MALTVEELQIVLSCDASTAQSVLEKMDATVKAYTEKFQKYFNGMGGGKGGVANSLVSQFEAAAEGIKKQTKAITKQTEDWKARYEKTFGETFDSSMMKAKMRAGASQRPYFPSGKEFTGSGGLGDKDYYKKSQEAYSAMFGNNGANAHLLNLGVNTARDLQAVYGQAKKIGIVSDVMREKIVRAYDALSKLGNEYARIAGEQGNDSAAAQKSEQAYLKAVYAVDKYVQQLGKAIAKEEKAASAGSAGWVPGGGGDSLFSLAGTISSRLQDSIGGVNNMSDTLRYKIESVIETVHTLGDAYKKALDQNGAEDKGTIALQKKFESAVYEADRYIAKLDQISAKEQEAEAASKSGSAGLSGPSLFQRLTEHIQTARSAIQSFGASMKKAFQATLLGRFLKQLGRTIMRMAAMKLIRGTIQGVQQGLQELAKTSASSAKAMNTITAAGGSIKMALGAAVMPIVKALAPMFVALASAINTAANAIARFFAVLTGQATYTATQFSGSLDGISESAGGAGKAAKGMLADFDELNVIANQGGGGGGGGGLASSLSKAGDDVPAVSQFAELVKKSWEQADFTFIGTILGEKLSGALESIPWDGINGALTKVATSISTFFNGIFANMGLADNLGSTIGQAFTTAYDTVTTLIGTLNWSNIGQFLTRAIQSAVKKFNFGSITKFISQKLIAVFEFKAGLYKGIDWKGLPKLLVDKITEAVRGFDFAGVAEAIGHWLGAGCRAALDFLDGLVDLLSGIVESIGSYFTKHINEAKEAGGSVIDGILAGISDALSAIGSWIKKNIWDPFVKGFKEAFGIASPAKTMEEPGQMVGEGILVGITNGLEQIKSIFVTLKDKIAAGLGLTYEYVKAFFVTLADYITTRGLLIKANVDKFMNNIKIAVLEKLKDVIDGMSSGPLGKLLKLIGVDLAGASESLGKSIDKAKEKNKELDTKIGELQTKAKQGFDISANVDATKVDSYKKTLAKGWALTVTPSVDSDELRRQLRAGTKINVKVNWKPSNGTPSTQIGIVQYAAAKGGIFSAPTTVLVGEYAGASSNPEVIAPLSKLQGILERSNVGGKDTMTREQANTMINLLQRIEQKEMTVSPSVGFGQVVQRSLDAYSRA